MTEKIFDNAFLLRLALAVRAIEDEGSEPSDPQPLDREDYRSIYVAYEESGGDPAAARKQIDLVCDQRDQALSRIVQFISDQYGSGPIEQLGDEALKDVARDAVDATECWMEDVEMHDAPKTQKGPLQLLLKTHYLFNEAVLDIHDQILWPLAKRISPED